MIRGTTYQRKDGRWECRLRLGSENGRKKYRSFYGSTKEEAEYKNDKNNLKYIMNEGAIT